MSNTISGGADGDSLISEVGGIDDRRSTVRVIECIDLSVRGLCGGPGGIVVDSEPVRGEKI